MTDDDGLVRRARIAVGTSDLDNKGRRRTGISFLDRPIHQLIFLKETKEFPDGEP